MEGYRLILAMFRTGSCLLALWVLVSMSRETRRTGDCSTVVLAAVGGGVKYVSVKITRKEEAEED